jgi:hypothetical protein
LDIKLPPEVRWQRDAPNVLVHDAAKAKATAEPAFKHDFEFPF